MSLWYLAAAQRYTTTLHNLTFVYTFVYSTSTDIEWHEAKREENLREHQVDFADAALIFTNPVLEAVDDRQAYGEVRYRALGHVEDDYFVVVYTWRGTTRRLISAWKVGDDGKRRYTAILARGTSGDAGAGGNPHQPGCPHAGTG